MNRIPVHSSNIESVGYDAATEMLEVEFQGKSVYQYSGVPLNVYKQLMLSDSKGKFLSSQVKGHYAVQRVN